MNSVSEGWLKIKGMDILIAKGEQYNKYVHNNYIKYLGNIEQEGQEFITPG